MRCAVQIAEGIRAGIDGACFKREGPLVRNPSRNRRLQHRAQIFSHVEEPDARASAKPLEYSTARKIDTKAPDVDRNRPSRLKNIEDDARTDAMRLLNNGTRIHDVSASKQYLRDRHQLRGF